MRYIFYIILATVSCKLQQSSTPSDLIVKTDEPIGVDFYLQIDDGALVVKQGNNPSPIDTTIKGISMSQPKNSATSENNSEQLLDSIDSVIIDRYKNDKHLLEFDQIEFTIRPRSTAEDSSTAEEDKLTYEYTCKFSGVVLGKVKFRINAAGCHSNARLVKEAKDKKLIKEKCGRYAKVELELPEAKNRLHYQSQHVNDNKSFSEGDIYVYEYRSRFRSADFWTECKQLVVFDSKAVEYMEKHDLACDKDTVGTRKMKDANEEQLKYGCEGYDLVFFSGQDDGTLLVVAKHKEKKTHETLGQTYYDGKVKSINAAGTEASEAVMIASEQGINLMTTTENTVILPVTN